MSGAGTRRTVVLGLVTALLLAAASPTVRPEPASAQDDDGPYLWLAAGDSYSAGEGVGDDAQRCQLSLFAYPRQVARGYGDSDDAWSHLFGEEVPPRTSDDIGSIWEDDLGAELVVTGRGGAFRDTAIEVRGRDEEYTLQLGTFRDFWEGRSTEQTVDVEQIWGACSGGRVEDLFNEENGRPPQLDILDDRRADLITMSMGGNDLGFGDLVNGCLGSSRAERLITSLRSKFPSSDCMPTLQDLQNRADALVSPDDDDARNLFDPADEVSCVDRSRRSDDPLPESAFRCSLPTADAIAGAGPDGQPGIGLVDVYAHIATNHLRAGTGEMVIVGYPRFFATRVESDLDGCSGFTDADVRLLNDGAEYLDRTLREAVAAANDLVDGEPIQYLSVLAAFDDNGLCGPGEDWLNGVNFDTSGGFASDSFHPTRAGHDGMTGLLRAEIEGLCGFRAYIAGQRSTTDCRAETERLLDQALFGPASSSTVLVVDVSTSMRDPSPVGDPIPKISAAIQASQDLISVVEVDAQGGFEHSVGLVSFNQDAMVITRATGDLRGAAADAANLVADGNTDVGAGLDTGIDTVLGGVEVSRIVLLSDGDITDGLSQDGVLTQIVPRAVGRTIPIDVIGFAAPGSLDETFLRSIATETGGRFSLAQTAQELRRDFIRTRHEATGTVVVELVGDLDPRSDSPVTDFEVEAGTEQLIITLGHDSERTDLRPILYDPLGRPVADEAVRIVGSNPTTVAVDNPLPGQWSVYVNEPDRPAADDEIRWSPPIDGDSAGAVVAQTAADDGAVPFILVVSTRSGSTIGPDRVALSSRGSLPWVAAGVLTAAALLTTAGFGVVVANTIGGSAANGRGRDPGRGAGGGAGGGAGAGAGTGSGRRWRTWAGVAVLVGAAALFLLAGAALGGLGG